MSSVVCDHHRAERQRMPGDHFVEHTDGRTLQPGNGAQPAVGIGRGRM